MSKRTYVIKKGETLYTVAHKFSCPVSLLCRVNDVLFADVVHPGDEVKIPTEQEIRKYEKRENIIDGILRILALAFVVAVGFGIWKAGSYIYNWIKNYEPPVCYYEYVDNFGNRGEASTCSTNWGNLYCSNDNEVIDVQYYKEVCE